MEPGKREAMLRGILVIDIVVDKVEGQRKLNQHKSDEDYRSVAVNLAKSADAGAREIATKMLELRPSIAIDR